MASWGHLNMDRRVCGVPDQLGVGQICKWPDPRIGHALMQALDGHEEDQRRIDRLVFAHVAQHCGADVVEVEQAYLARIRTFTHDFRDGPGGVLADCELPCSMSVLAVAMRIDVQGEWNFTWPWDGRGLPYFLVKLHELLHGLGLPHAPAGVVAVMAAMLNTRLVGLQPWDIEQLQVRYPKVVVPLPAPLPTPSPVPEGGAMEFILKLFQFLKDNPWIIDLLKKLLDRSAAQGGLTLADVADEVQQLRA